MGACQSAGGAATSGAGLHGDQVAFAIREGIHILGDGEKQAEVDGGAQLKVPAANAFKDIQKKTLKYVPPEGIEKYCKEGEAPQACDMEVTSYAPEVFRYLRQLEGSSDTQCADEWNLPPETTNMDLGSGRSMALFLKSKNLDFMAKTIAEVEVNVLMDVLEQYTEHLTKNQNSVLMRFTMLYKVEVPEKNILGYILCFGDLFSTCPRLNELWDIKGRVPKPGKYLHFPSAKKVSSTFHEDASSISGTKAGGPSAFDNANADDNDDGGAMHKRSHSNLAGADGAIDDAAVEPMSPTSHDLKVRKDKDLSRLFWVPEPQRKELLAQLHADYKILADNGLMDYSILIGVKYNTADEEGVPAPPPGSPGIGNSATLRRRKLCGEAPGGEQQVRPAKGRGSSAQHKSRCVYHDGVISVGNQETYFIGVIDMLTIYNIKKKSANFFKSFLWEPETLSTIPPRDYQARIDDFTDLIFPPLEDPDEDE